MFFCTWPVKYDVSMLTTLIKWNRRWQQTYMLVTGLWRLLGHLLLGSDVGRRADLAAYIWLHWHYSQEGVLILHLVSVRMWNFIVLITTRIRVILSHIRWRRILKCFSRRRLLLRTSHLGLLPDAGVSSIIYACLLCCEIRGGYQHLGYECWGKSGSYQGNFSEFCSK